MTLRFADEEQFRQWNAQRQARRRGSSVDSDVRVNRKVEKPKKLSRGTGALNKTETRWLERLQVRQHDGEIRGFVAQSLKFRLANPRCWYLPDFLVIHLDGSLELQEIKGPRIWDDALVKFKVARESYPAFRWSMWQWANKGWRQLH